MDVQLRKLEGVREPLGALGVAEWRDHLLAPPQSRLTRVSVAEPHQALARVKRAEGFESRIRRVAPQSVGKADDPAVPRRKSECSTENPQGLIQQAAAQLLRGHLPHRESVGHLFSPYTKRAAPG